MTQDDIKRLKHEIRFERRWQERAQLILRYHLYQCGERSDKRNNKWRISDTAGELDLSIGAVSENIHLARAIRTNPELKLKTRDEALTILRKLKNGTE